MYISSYPIRQDLRDIVSELDRILSLHYSDDMEAIKQCCYKADGEPPQVIRANSIFLFSRTLRRIIAGVIHP